MPGPRGRSATGQGGDLAQPRRVPRRFRQRGGAGDPRPQPRDRGHAGCDHPGRGLGLQKLGEGRGDSHGDAAVARPVEDPLSDCVPRALHVADQPGGLVVEDLQLFDTRILRDGVDDLAQPAAIAPDHRGVVEGIRDSRSGWQQLEQAALGRRRERRELDPALRRLVAGGAGVTSRASHHGKPAPRPPPPRRRPPEGERLRQLEQFMKVGRGHRPGLLDQCPETRWSPATAPVCAAAAEAPASDEPP